MAPRKTHSDLLARKVRLEKELAAAIKRVEESPTRANQIKYGKVLNSYIILIEKLQ